ncbi:hypothetical protein E1264_11790 [Actinomadura sp. KC216]|uniref:hypothetical protein n=1 Tax=Actinomadura sp. KC216 TaxID=2530370 RepID=UPI00104C5468|nr:hypothetical protein [Actinomadura sp. KC216]TDB88357.1 hypothetical protein E1264_11790 [Actinomadura sp. KC216]
MTSQILPGVPASVPRSKVAALAESLGFNVRDLLSLEFHNEAVHAEVFAHHPGKDRGADGRAWRYAVGEHAATHRVCIRITDDPDEKASDA